MTIQYIPIQYISGCIYHNTLMQNLNTVMLFVLFLQLIYKLKWPFYELICTFNWQNCFTCWVFFTNINGVLNIYILSITSLGFFNIFFIFLKKSLMLAMAALL